MKLSYVPVTEMPRASVVFVIFPLSSYSYLTDQLELFVIGSVKLKLVFDSCLGYFA
ncbi:MAG TPA: hypothetical protein PKY59_16900 [Pyrinomonadaceae bacterium]|nr:hypothetical protein [Pyrinomonadaceae bacterium]